MRRLRWCQRTVIIGALMLAVVVSTVMYGATLFTVVALAAALVVATNDADWWRREAGRRSLRPGERERPSSMTR